MRGNMRRDKGGLEVNEYMYSNTKYKGMFPEVDILRLLRVSKHGHQNNTLWIREMKCKTLAMK